MKESILTAIGSKMTIRLKVQANFRPTGDYYEEWLTRAQTKRLKAAGVSPQTDENIRSLTHNADGTGMAWITYYGV